MPAATRFVSFFKRSIRDVLSEVRHRSRLKGYLVCDRSPFPSPGIPPHLQIYPRDAGKARKKLGWEPKYDLNALIADMMQSDIHMMKKESYLQEGGYRTLNYFE